MSQLELKYRPKDLDEIVGNKNVKRSFKTLSQTRNIPATILFYGPPGTGKTTTARIIAKLLLCKDLQADGSACRQCANCLELEKTIQNNGAQSKLPVYEFDIGQMGTKDEVKKIIDQMKQRSLVAGNTRIFILDEAQRMSPEAQASLLKITEEPAPGLYIFLCTTDPEDLLPAIKTRIRHFPIKKPKLSELRDHLARICQEEGISYEPEALANIVKYSNRGPREAMVKLDTFRREGPIINARVLDSLMVTGSDVYTEYFEVLEQDPFNAMQFIEILPDKYDLEHENFLEGLPKFVTDIIKIKAGVLLENYTQEETKRIKKVLKNYTLEEMTIMLNNLYEILKVRANPEYLITVFTLKTKYPQLFDRMTPSERSEKLTEEINLSNDNYQAVTDELELHNSEYNDKPASAEEILELFGGSIVSDK